MRYFLVSLALLVLLAGAAQARYRHYQPRHRHHHEDRYRDSRSDFDFYLGPAFAGPVDERYHNGFFDRGGFGGEGGLGYRITPAFELGVASGYYSLEDRDPNGYAMMRPVGGDYGFNDSGRLSRTSAVVPLTGQLSFDLLPYSPVRLLASVGGGLYWVRERQDVIPLTGASSFAPGFFMEERRWSTLGGFNAGLAIQGAGRIAPGLNARVHVIDPGEHHARENTLVTVAATLNFH